MQIGGSVKNPNRRRRHSKGLMSEINITPFVDVMLVLLIIFMVTAPLLTAGVKVDLPESSSKHLSGQDEPLTVTIKNDGSIYLQKTKIAIDNLGPKLNAIGKRKTDTRIFVRGDKKVNYGRMIDVMSAINNAGFMKVALVTEHISK